MYSDPSQIRTRTVKVRLNAEEKRTIEAAAFLLGMSLSEYCREAMLDSIVSAFMPTDSAD